MVSKAISNRGCSGGEGPIRKAERRDGGRSIVMEDGGKKRGGAFAIGCP